MRSSTHSGKESYTAIVPICSTGVYNPHIGMDTFNIVNKHHEVYPVVLYWGTPTSSFILGYTNAADSNFIKHDKAVCTYYHYAKIQQIYSFIRNSDIRFYLNRGYQRLSFAKRLWYWFHYKRQIPCDKLLIHFTNTTLTSSIKG